MKKITENDYMKVYSNLEMKGCIREEKAQQDVLVTYIDIHAKNQTEIQNDGMVRLEFVFPATDISGRWFPICKFDRSVKADYDSSVESMAASSAPVVCFYNSDGRNRHTIALSEVRQKVFMKCGIHEEDGNMLCVIEIPVTQGSGDKDWKIAVWESTEEKNTGKFWTR